MLSRAGIFAAVAFAAIIAFAGAVYVIAQGSGNVAQNSCPDVPALAATLKGKNSGAIAAFSFAERGFDAGNLAFDDKDGTRVSLAKWKGRVVLLNLWATWCAPCREEMPSLKALQQALGSAGFEVVPVSVDLGNSDKPKAFYAQNDLAGLPFYHDGKLGVFNELKKQGLAFGMPTTLLIDRAGCVAGSLNGPADWGSDEAKALMKEAISAPANQGQDSLN